jgi:transposase-like protein
MGNKNNSYTASYKSKVISFAEQFGNRAAKRELGILESNVLYWRKQKELFKNAKSGSRTLRGPKAGKSAYFTHPDFSAAKLEEKSTQITRVNRVIVRM